jgi:hypothetical protein
MLSTARGAEGLRWRNANLSNRFRLNRVKTQPYYRKGFVRGVFARDSRHCANCFVNRVCA